MTWEEALKLIVERTRNLRYIELTADANLDVTQRDAYRSLLIRIATGAPESSLPKPEPAPDLPSVAESIDLIRQMRACPYRSVDAGCGCSGGRCALRGGAMVGHIDCFDCLRHFG
jgi:hypothetical protein